MRRALWIVFAVVIGAPLWAAEIHVDPGQGTLAAAIAGAAPGDALHLRAGGYLGAVVIDRPLTLAGPPEAIIDGQGEGTVVTIDAPDVTLRGVTVTGSGRSSQDTDAGVKILRAADRAVVEDNRVLGNLHGIDVHGGHDALVRNNTIEGTRQPRLNDRGNGIYVWNSPGAVIEGNSVRWGRDGIFSNATRAGTYRNNLFRDLRFAVHYMYTNDTEVSGNVSIGNHLGFAIMFSDRAVVRDNLSLSDRDHGVMLNFANSADVSGNLVRGGAEKCTFIYNANKNLIYDNRFEGCDIGIHFTAGSERNVLTGNAFVGNRTQVKYVGTTDIEWSFEGRGNYWSDHPGFDLDGDGIADSSFRPNDLMDHILWSQPAAGLLTGAPAVQLIRWAQSSFPATLPGGVVDSAPLMEVPAIAVPDEYATLEAEVAGRWNESE
ncbi:nitrous oxide reductase family maturation protein NosD [Thalassorhabdomicrobium marinisediminis]|uniref:Nitrous oxide reductase family maturation protein NosD n=1 Tax=Thalassorhabdomicrobium marinisediminis TaxID=2170577 RepID=A0A2T7FZ25_9RHOB|nr:nitrous oxide reductase family maturation protein NosD [Thalassorhabdomicrobium marinisediminis]PVA07411.1 nitrous oxide reductase family maturation protein NosD [Thalassorhabdomicrobium marinisediminis]